jgi:hypothetical protein
MTGFNGKCEWLTNDAGTTEPVELVHRQHSRFGSTSLLRGDVLHQSSKMTGMEGKCNWLTNDPCTTEPVKLVPQEQRPNVESAFLIDIYSTRALPCAFGDQGAKCIDGPLPL